MSYVKQNFKDGDVLTAEQLNYIEDGIAELEAVGGKLVENVSNHESRISTLEEGGGSSGGGKLYIHQIYINANDGMSWQYGTWTMYYLSYDSTPINTLGALGNLKDEQIIKGSGTCNLSDSPEGEREIKSFYYRSHLDQVELVYINEYSVPMRTGSLYFSTMTQPVTVKDTVKEVV